MKSGTKKTTGKENKRKPKPDGVKKSKPKVKSGMKKTSGKGDKSKLYLYKYRISSFY